MKQNKTVSIVGGGASGLFLAILLDKAIPGTIINIFETQVKVGKKILQTGNGKCNLGNENINISEYNTNKIKYLLDKVKMDDILDVFNSLGLKVRCDSEGRIYPYSEKATTVIDVLLKYITNSSNIFIYTDTFITSITKAKATYFLKSQNKTYESSYVIMCTGGKSSINFKYNAYEMVEKLGHHVTNLSPSLCALKVKENTKALSGIRVKCKASMIVDNKVVKTTDGEVLFKDDGLSGVAIFILSQYYDKSKDCYISLDLLKEETSAQLNQELYNNNPLADNLTGYFPKMVNLEIINRSKVKLVGDVIKDFRFKVLDTYGFNNAQVTKGGINLDEVDTQTFESKLLDNLYFAGEILDVDGSCGGFNLYFAFASSYLISLDITKKILGEL